jgi:predicted transcriptional regulator
MIARQKVLRNVYLSAYIYVAYFGEVSMASETVRIKSDTHVKLRTLAEESGQSMPEILEQAIESLRRQRLLDASNAAYAALKQDAKGWKAELDERALWDATLSDGLERKS